MLGVADRLRKQIGYRSAPDVLDPGAALAEGRFDTSGFLVVPPSPLRIVRHDCDVRFLD